MTRTWPAPNKIQAEVGFALRVHDFANRSTIVAASCRVLMGRHCVWAGKHKSDTREFDFRVKGDRQHHDKVVF